MKKLLLAACCLLSFAANAQSTLIHYWNFNNYNQGAMYTPTISAVDVDYTRVASPKAAVLYTGLYDAVGNWQSYLDSNISSVGAYDTVNLRMGDTAGIALRARNNSDSMQLLFYIPTTHYTNIQLKYATQTSGKSGQQHQLFAYSVDSGSSWITSGTGLSSWADSAWDVFNLVSVHFNDAKAANNPKLVFRITFSGNTHTTGAKGNNRFDNITVEGDTIKPILRADGATVSGRYQLWPNPVANSLTVSNMGEGIKIVAIYNMVGQQLYVATTGEHQQVISVADLAPGNYIVNIQEQRTGQTKNLRFVKQ